MSDSEQPGPAAASAWNVPEPDPRTPGQITLAAVVTEQGQGFVRITHTSPAYGLVWVHVPEGIAEIVAQRIVETARFSRQMRHGGLIVPEVRVDPSMFDGRGNGQQPG